MPALEKIYSILLTDKDVIKVRQLRDGAKVIEFSVQYNSLIAGRWHKITRFDNAHGKPHRHVFYPQGPEYRHDLASTSANFAFTESLITIKRSYKHWKESYIMIVEKQKGLQQ